MTSIININGKVYDLRCIGDRRAISHIFKKMMDKVDDEEGKWVVL